MQYEENVTFDEADSFRLFLVDDTPAALHASKRDAAIFGSADYHEAHVLDCGHEWHDDETPYWNVVKYQSCCQACQEKSSHNCRPLLEDC